MSYLKTFNFRFTNCLRESFRKYYFVFRLTSFIVFHEHLFHLESFLEQKACCILLLNESNKQVATIVHAFCKQVIKDKKNSACRQVTNSSSWKTSWSNQIKQTMNFINKAGAKAGVKAGVGTLLTNKRRKFWKHFFRYCASSECGVWGVAWVVCRQSIKFALLSKFYRQILNEKKKRSPAYLPIQFWHFLFVSLIFGAWRRIYRKAP